MNYLTNAGALILQFVFGAVVTLFVLRLLAEAHRADFNNPICQFLYRFTNPVLRPLRRALPNVRRVNTAALLIILALECLKVVLIVALAGFAPAIAGVIVAGIAETVDFFLLTWIVLVFVWSLMSMLSTDRYHPVARLVSSLAEPLVRPLRGRMTIGGLDFSPTVVLLGLFLLRILVAQPLSDWGTRLLMGG
ncbi:MULTISPECIES: YggT family protein [unclassified Luteibacter]|uniref:YggT family protein n=1 Tax=unclassified Luteibacter TaxID=2620188 RepID=UPI0008ADF64B|nr:MULTISPECIES: YggT family protein [unclassified Luteibacter]MDR6936578.1 YggT family protein [Luteibacter sp. 3190]SEV84225.1 YggT family protein [Luteibacter sp. 329MFSha]